MPYVLSFWLFNNIGEAYRIASGRDTLWKIIEAMHMLGTAFTDSIVSFNSFDIIVGLIGSGSMFAMVYYKKIMAKKFRKDKEYGSACWGKPDDIKPYIDPKFKNNIILTKTEFLTLDSRPANPKYARNKNVLVIGGSGSGKTRFFVKPNLMQLHSSYVVTDPKGQILVECGKLLKHNKYRIKVLNTINFKKSMCYNPFVYIKSEKDILKLVTALITNTKGEGTKSGEDFWIKAESLLYSALIGYIHYEGSEEERNMNTLVELVNAMEVREDNEEFKNPVDLMFEALEERDPEHFARPRKRLCKRE